MKAFSLGIIAALALSIVGFGTAAAASHSTGTARVATAKTSLGRIIVDARGRSLYLFEKDKHGKSACSGACATIWPPLITHGKATVSGGAKRSLIGSTRRADGRMQVTYAGHPLYRYAADTRRGQTTGEGSHDFGAGWYVITPAGKKIDRD